MNDNFETIIDSDGKEHRILKDKGRTRVPVMFTRRGWLLYELPMQKCFSSSTRNEAS